MILPIRKTSGFTLIELMCAMAIGSIILLLSAHMLGISGDGYERIGGGVASEREARALITQLTSDLSSALFHKDGVIEKSTAPWATDRLGFLCLQPVMAQTEASHIGDLCSVNYYIKDLTIGGKIVRCLMRGSHESKETFKSLEPKDASGNDNVSSLFVVEQDETLDGADEPVAFGVVSFEARPKTRDQSGKWIDWVKNTTTGPDALDVRLVIARRGLCGTLKQSQDWDGIGSAGKLLGAPSEAYRNENLEVYATLIHFGNHENF